MSTTSVCFAVTESTVAAAGVAVYIHNHLSADIWTCPGDSSQFELLWVRVQAQRHEVVIDALYHPPKPLYKPTALLDYIVDALTAVFPKTTIFLAGDFNSLDDSTLVSLTALSSVVTGYSLPTQKRKAIIACAGQRPLQPLNKTRQRLVFRRRSPTQHVVFLEHVSQLNIELDTTLPC